MEHNRGIANIAKENFGTLPAQKYNSLRPTTEAIYN